MPETSRDCFGFARRSDACTSPSATAMAHHYPPHIQTQGYQSYSGTAPYGYAGGYYPAGFPSRPGASGYTFDSATPGAALTHPQGGPPAPPEIPGVSAQLASDSIQRLIAVEMRDAGFVSAETGAMRRLEQEVVACTSNHKMNA